MMQIHPIAFFCSHAILEKPDLSRQAYMEERRGHIRFLPGNNFEQALEDLQGIERIWVLFWMDQSRGWKPKVLTPRGGNKKGVFATRAPYRPNPIGLSCVKLVSVKGRVLEIEGFDLLDQTPILDIKPYLPYADSFPSSKTGWIEEGIVSYKVVWDSFALEQMAYLEKQGQETNCWKKNVEKRLEGFCVPSSYNRIRHLREDLYELAYKTWRFLVSKREGEWIVQALYSGYDDKSLRGEKSSRWEDLPLHRAFTNYFSR